MEATTSAVLSVRTRGIQVHGKKLAWCSGITTEESEEGGGALTSGELVSILISQGTAGTPSDLRGLRRTPSGTTALPGRIAYFIARFACGEREKSRNSKGAIVLHATAFISIEAAAPLPGEEDLMLFAPSGDGGGTACADEDEAESGPSSQHREDKIERHTIFADWIVATFGCPDLVVDVAAGKGHLAHCVCVDPEARPDATCDGVEWVAEPWSEALAKSLLATSSGSSTSEEGGVSGDVDTLAANSAATRPPPPPILMPPLPVEPPLDSSSVATTSDILTNTGRPLSALFVGLHPDQATEGIVDAALERGLAFAVVPCCVYPSLFPNRRMINGWGVGGQGRVSNSRRGVATIGVTSYRGFLAYLRAKDPRVRL
eukprot:CAMPEP_0180699200 /NCGR_PEP_ID=MMETSP1038_2-20121128/4428_1 /TAXON_ID=632150 /ORGANISM="Azadinium spinosum, Strain 3D9" /LENGTH=373 /DNA_ID=CAMNT_0022730815 /DNA_START=136 /DNA_END=1255 /DNA_ORIENTATION=-